MFDSQVYVQRRERLKKQVGSGILLFLGNEESPMNYADNPYPFRQDSSFLYFFGLDSPSLAAVIDVEENRDILFGDDIGVEGIIWMGHLPSLKERATLVGIQETAPLAQLEKTLKKAVQERRKIHYLPPCRPENAQKLEDLLGIHPSRAKDDASSELIKAVVELRSVKSPEEVKQMEIAQQVTYEMYMAAKDMVRPGIFEREIVGKMEGIVLASGCRMAFPTILTINGQVLHNHDHSNVLKEGRLLVIDAGAESPMNYASDITRTFPVSGKFTQKQREIYEIVLNAQETAIEAIKPGIHYRDIHLKIAAAMAAGLKELGLMKGNIDEVVKAGAHALFFPHGLGHMIGLDTHDMEDIGEDFVGYDESVKRSEQFGFAYLRLAKKLKPGFAITVEPGLYFIPPLIDKWVSEKKSADFINYERVDQYRDFGGIRIEDDVLVTEEGCCVLGKSIPKRVEEL